VLKIIEHLNSTVTSSKTGIKYTVFPIEEKLTIITMVYDIYNCPCKKKSFNPLMPNITHVMRTVMLKM